MYYMFRYLDKPGPTHNGLNSKSALFQLNTVFSPKIGGLP